MDVTVVVATFGGNEWKQLATERAIPSAHRQAPTIHAHAETLAKARNKGLAKVESEFVIFLDADDELEPRYVEAMATGTADLRAPRVRFMRDQAYAARVPRVAGHRHRCTPECLPEGNWLVIGTAARTALLREVGGWEEWPLYEDWALWLRCYLAGATIEAVPDAVYRAHVRDDSRNRAPDERFCERIHGEIYASCFSTGAAA